jgi:LuxR family quorum sensing-dependent transcriptional regulator
LPVGNGMPEVDDYGRNALDFIEAIETLGTTDAVMNAMEKAFGRFGFETIILAGLPNPDQRFEQLVLAKRWPAEWFKTYTANNYIRDDPTVRLLRRSVYPFEWCEAPYDGTKEPRAAEIMRRAAECGMANGFVVPIHSLTGYEACLSLGGKHLDLTKRSKPALHLMGMYAFDRVRRLLATPPPVRKLTAREREAIAWTARGKSAWDIGGILRISQRTVEQHATNACSKLGATNRAHAVAIAIRERLIEP